MAGIKDEELPSMVLQYCSEHVRKGMKYKLEFDSMATDWKKVKARNLVHQKQITKEEQDILFYKGLSKYLRSEIKVPVEKAAGKLLTQTDPPKMAIVIVEAQKRFSEENMDYSSSSFLDSEEGDMYPQPEGDMSKSCYMCGKTQGIDLDHPFVCIQWEIGKGGIVALLIAESKARSGDWYRDLPLHQTMKDVQGVGLLWDSQEVIQGNVFVVATDQVYSFPAVMRSKAKPSVETESEEKASGLWGGDVKHAKGCRSGRPSIVKIQPPPDKTAFTRIEDGDSSGHEKGSQMHASNTEEGASLELQKRITSMTKVHQEFSAKTDNDHQQVTGCASSLLLDVTEADEGGDLAASLGSKCFYDIASGVVHEKFSYEDITFLVDSSSELNLVMSWVYEQAGIEIDSDGARWSLKGISEDSVPLLRCCRDTPVKIGGWQFHHHFFVDTWEFSNHDGILDQPWLQWYSTQIDYTRGVSADLLTYPSGDHGSKCLRICLISVDNS
ncbi:uncharacterized protein LAESUDRAFT_714693 [Laetiporus sulphureus 93-53]|uniref:DUF4100 domain-containing protein n=1 Tax=Laetiporus sulphureus 93-53 TaxID=1314785 RepID=A0A165DV14_9APHY|nr:uncharacterized protein LAESUDRAFT_714693 [Laetiporus sulphureus 93-53]KZT05683.1 hypothetical protein LAESUDRAFT_714693 [Laetiporus sulphureus 93-53]